MTKSIARAFGNMLAGLEKLIFGWLAGHIQLTPDRFQTWLQEHGFERNEGGTIARPRYVADYAGFARWFRNSLLTLFAWALMFELYSIVIGSSNQFGFALGIGVLIFFGVWIFWLGFVVGRINWALFWIFLGLSIALAGILIGAPVWQYYHAEALVASTPAGTPIQSLSFTAQKIQTLISAGIPRWWALLGFLLMTMIILPVVWTVNLAPALFTLVFSKAPEKVKEFFIEFLKLLPLGSRTSEAAAKYFQERTAVEIGMVRTAWLAIALLCTALFVTPTVWSLFGGILITMLSIIVYHLLDSWQFRGYLFRKYLYGVACGFLIMVSCLFGFSLITMLLIYALSTNWFVFGIVLFVLLGSIASGLFVALTSVPQKENEELSRGDGNIEPYTKRVTGFNADGSPIFAVVQHQHHNPGSENKHYFPKWLTALILIAVVGLIGFLAWSNPSSIGTGFNWIYNLGPLGWLVSLVVIYILISTMFPSAKKVGEHHG